MEELPSNEVPVILLFNAFGMLDLDEIVTMIQHTCRWATLDIIKSFLNPTLQHASVVRTKDDALRILSRSLQQNQKSVSGNGNTNVLVTTHDLLCANVLPHLTTVKTKCEYLAYLVGILLNYVLHEPSTRSIQFDVMPRFYLQKKTSHSSRTTWGTNVWIPVERCSVFFGYHDRSF